MIKAGCCLSGIIFNATIVLPEPGGATITPKSFLAIDSTTVSAGVGVRLLDAAAWCFSPAALNYNASTKIANLYYPLL
jgi:hypothetical protein